MTGGVYCRAVAYLIAGAMVTLAQSSRPCEIPKEIAGASDARNAAGAWFAQRGNTRCAIYLFREALRADPKSVNARYNLGLALIDAGQFAGAEAELRKLLAESPNARVHVALGVAKQGLHDDAAAEAEFRTALKLEPRSAIALQHLGESLAAQKRYTAATGAFREAAGIDPQNVDHAIALAQALDDIKSPDEGIAVLQSFIARQPNSALAEANLGTLLARQKRYSDAVGHFQRAITLDAGNMTARLSLAKALIALDRQPDAIPVLDEYLRQNASDSEARELRGIVYRGTADYESAAEDLRAAVAANPGSYRAQYNLGFVLARLNRFEEARGHLEEARRLEPDSQEVEYQLANVLRRLNQDDSARQQLAELAERKQREQTENIASMTAGRANQKLVEGDAHAAVNGYQEALKLDPSNAKTWYNLALAQQRVGSVDAAMASLEKSVKLDFSFAAAHNQLGLTYMSRGRNADADREFNLGIRNDPQCAECQNNLGVLHGQAGDAKRAESLFRAAIENSPDYAQARVNLALIEAGREDFPSARADLQKAIAREPGNIKALTALGMVQARTHDAAATETFRRVIALDPKSAEAHINLGIALADEHHTDEALAQFTEAVHLAGNSAAAHYNRGRMLTDLHRASEALPDLKDACRLDPNTPDAFFRLGIAQREISDNAAAADALATASRLDPHNAEAAFLLGQSLQAIGRTQEATEAWKRTLAIEPENTQALYALVRASVKTSPELAAKYRDRLTEVEQRKGLNERAQALSNASIAAANKGDWDSAIAQLHQAIQVCAGCSSLPTLRKNLGLTECRAGHYSDGEKTLREALTDLPADPEILKALDVLAGMRAKQ